MLSTSRLSTGAASVALALIVAGCSMGSSQRFQTAQVEQATPVQQSSVATGTLPPIGSPGAQPAPGLSGTPVLGGVPPATPGTMTGSTTVASNTQQLPQLGTAAPGAPGSLGTGARDLSGGVTVDRLLGAWTLASGGTQCRLNLTYTTKEGTSRYRASTPGCQIPGLAAVGSWQLAGPQIQLFDEGGNLVAALVQSGNSFIGTAAGGAAVTMSA